MKYWPGLILLCLGIAGPAGLFLAGATAPSASAAHVPSCAWSGERDQRDINIGAPDLDAFYYASSVSPKPGTKIVVSGRFPKARYFSFTLYNAGGQPIASAYDAQIAADKGSANPFRGPGPVRASDRYHVQVLFVGRPSHPAARTLYVGPPANAASSLLLVLRIYVPAHPSRPGPFPSLTTETIGGAVLLARAACATIFSTNAAARWKHYAESSAPRRASTPTVAGATWAPTWSRSFGSQFGNPQNAYLMTLAAHHWGQLLVIHARAPTFPNTLAGEPVYGHYQLRYWSFCTYDSLGQAVIGCAADYRAAIRGGYLTYVISDPVHRPRKATAVNGVTWLPWGPKNAIQIIYRNMLPERSFRNAVQRIRNTRQSIRATMGPYYPEAVYCSEVTFAKGGWAACRRSTRK